MIPLQLAFTAVFKPFVRLLNGTANLLLRAVGIEPKEELSSARTAEELRCAGTPLRERGIARPRHRDAARAHAGVLRPHRGRCDDARGPRLAAVARADNADAVLALARSTGYSRFPVFEEDIDDIVGVVHVKQAVGGPARTPRAGAGVGPAVRRAACARDHEARHAARRAARPRIPDGGRRRRVRRNRRRRDPRGPRRGAGRRGRRRARPVTRRRRAQPQLADLPRCAASRRTARTGRRARARGGSLRNRRRLDHERTRPDRRCRATPSRSKPAYSGSSGWTAGASTASGSPRRRRAETGEVER